MSPSLARRAGAAVVWRGAQLVVAQVVSLARLLVLARLLAPDDFGLLAIAAVVVTTLMTLTDVGMVPALVQRGAELHEGHEHAAWTVGVVRAVTIAALLIAVAPWLAAAFDDPRATPVIQALALRPVLEAAASIRVARLTRELRFRSLAAIVLGGVVTDAIVAVALASRLGVWALVAGVLSGAMARLVLSYVLAPYRPRPTLRRELVAPLARFGRWIMVTGVVVIAGNGLLQLVVARTLGTDALGLYYLSMKLAFLPVEVATQMVGSVVFPVAARLQRDVAATVRTFRVTAVGASALLLPAYVLLVVLAPGLVEFVLGARWAGTETVIRILALSGMVGLLGEVIPPFLKGLGRPDGVALIEALQSVVLVSSAWLLSRHFGLPGAAGAWIPATVASQVAGVLVFRRLVPAALGGLARPIGGALFAALAGGGVAAAVDSVVPGVAGVVLAGLAGGGVTLAALRVLDRPLGIGLADSVGKAFPGLADRLGISSF